MYRPGIQIFFSRSGAVSALAEVLVVSSFVLATSARAFNPGPLDAVLSSASDTVNTEVDELAPAEDADGWSDLLRCRLTAQDFRCLRFGVH